MIFLSMNILRCEISNQRLSKGAQITLHCSLLAHYLDTTLHDVSLQLLPICLYDVFVLLLEAMLENVRAQSKRNIRWLWILGYNQRTTWLLTWLAASSDQEPKLPARHQFWHPSSIWFLWLEFWLHWLVWNGLTPMRRGRRISLLLVLSTRKPRSLCHRISSRLFIWTLQSLILILVFFWFGTRIPALNLCLLRQNLLRWCRPSGEQGTFYW